MIDDNFKPFLLELNYFPSLAQDLKAQQNIKPKVFNGGIDIVLSINNAK